MGFPFLLYFSHTLLSLICLKLSLSFGARALLTNTIAVRAEITHFVPQPHPTSRYLLALICMPGSSITNEDHFKNSTSRLVIETILGRTTRWGLWICGFPSTRGSIFTP